MKVRINTLKGYEKVSSNYWITDDGMVLSERKHMKPLVLKKTKPTKKSRNRYLEVCVIELNPYKKRYVKVHRFVAKAFVKNDDSENKIEVNHINGDGYDNRAKNLEWVTPQENSRWTNAKRVYCYSLDGLVKIYECLDDVKKDGFNAGHVGSVCRQSIAKGRRFPMLRHKGFTFSYEPLEHKEVVQRLSKKPFYQPEGRIVPKHYKKRN
jgi:hypothetical protein